MSFSLSCIPLPSPWQEQRHARGTAGRLVVAGFPTATAALLPRAIARLTALHPGHKVQLIEAPTPAQLTAMRRGRMEVAIIATGDGLPEYDLAGLRLTALRSARGTGVAVAESHPFAVRERIEPDELADQETISTTERGGMRGRCPRNQPSARQV